MAIFIDIIILEKKLCYKMQPVFSVLRNEMLEVDHVIGVISVDDVSF